MDLLVHFCMIFGDLTFKFIYINILQTVSGNVKGSYVLNCYLFIWMELLASSMMYCFTVFVGILLQC